MFPNVTYLCMNGLLGETKLKDIVEAYVRHFCLLVLVAVAIDRVCFARIMSICLIYAYYKYEFKLIYTF